MSLSDIHYPELKKLGYSDREIISWYAEKYNRFCCEFSFSSLYLWNDIYHYKLSFFNGWLIVFDTKLDFILMPMGEDVTLQGLLSLSKTLRQDGYSGDISNIPPQFIESYPDTGRYYDIENDRDLAEYIYPTEKLFALTGKKLRKKKNHISQFLRNYPNYQVKPMDAAVRKDCLRLAEAQLIENQKPGKSIRDEATVIKKCFNSFEKMQLEGIAVYIETELGSKLVSFSVYSRLNKDVFLIHFEKINYSYPGAAQIINWETAKVLRGRCKYINREQDLGIQGLRQAKLSYDPELIYPAIYLRKL
jgi:hypothetical protein